MTQNPSLQPPPSLSTVTTAVKGCYNCNSGDHWILHNVKFNGECRKFCTSCVLKQHPTSFCPTCFNLHDPNSLNPPLSSSSSSSSFSNRTLTCLKCNSVSHITCVPPNTPKSPYLCPPCSNPSFKFFDLKKPRKFRDHPHSGGDGGGSGSNSKKVVEEQEHYFDESAAKVLLLAARISAISMNRAVAVMRGEVDRKVREAALARKRAKEAIDHVMDLSSKLIYAKQQRRDVVAGPGLNYAPVKLEKNGGAHIMGVSGANNKVGNGNGQLPMAAVPVVGQSNGGNNEIHHVGKENLAG